jgi:hypothetical protein
MASASNVDQDLAHRQRVFNDYSRFLNVTTLAGCILAPALIALPPRKLDLYTFSLGTAFVLSLDYQSKQRTGLGLMGHTYRPFSSRQIGRSRNENGDSVMAQQSRLLEESAPRIVQGGAESLLQRKMQEDWKQQRLREEQEKLDQGEGYWDMIKDQVWQVWNQEENKMEELKEKDEEVVKQRSEKG